MQTKNKSSLRWFKKRSFKTRTACGCAVKSLRLYQKVLERCCRKTTGCCFSNCFSSLLLSFAGKLRLEETSHSSSLRLSAVAASRWSSYSSGDTCWQKVNAARQRDGHVWVATNSFKRIHSPESCADLETIHFKYQLNIAAFPYWQLNQGLFPAAWSSELSSQLQRGMKESAINKVHKFLII